MHLLAPASYEQLGERAEWFKKPLARQLSETKEVEFGFELKGEPETITSPPPLFWGYHLPDTFATEWYYHQEKRAELFESITKFSKLSPDYLNLHGIHLWWQPPARQYIRRYANHSEPEEYLKVLNANLDLIRELKKILPKVHLTLENYPLYNYYVVGGKYIPETYLYTGTGRLNDLLYLRQKAGIDIMLDIEHLILTLNFLNRERNYTDLPREEKAAAHAVSRIYGYVLEKDVIPYLPKPVTFEEIVKKIGAKFYHLSGSVQDVIPGKKILTHEPIKLADKVFRHHLRLVLAEKPKVMLLETASRDDNPCWSYLRPNETELSFDNLCQILLEEM